MHSQALLKRASKCGGVLSLKNLKMGLDSLDQHPFAAPAAAGCTSLIIHLLRECSALKALKEGRQLHEHAIRIGLNRKRLIANLVMHMYGKCGSVHDARRVFDLMPKRDVVSWTTMIAIYAEVGSGKLAFDLFGKMWNEGVLPNKVTFLSILSAFVHPSDLAQGKAVHALIADSPYKSDVVIENALIHMYGKCGSLKDAHLVFDEMLDRDVVSWNAIIAACSRNNAGGQALELFVRMLEDGLAPTKVTFLNLLDACISISSLEHGKLMHACISGCGLASDLALANALINMYGKCGSPEHARFVFEKMLERDVVSWTSMISVCAQHGLHKEAIKLFEEMQTKGVKPNRVTVLSVLGACASPAALAQGKLFHQYLVRNGFNYDSAVGNALINMYAKCGSLEDACSLFKKLAKRDVVSWNTLIAMYNQHGHADAALEAFRKMQSIGVLPDKITLLSLFEACASLAALEEGTSIHASFFDKQQLKLDSTMATALLNMYGKCGSLEDSRCIFNSLAERDVVSWNSMIVTYAQHGYGLLGLQLFSMMQDGYLEPDNITFIAVLSACSHSGLVQEGIHYFASMKMYHKFIPTMRHYGCMVDLFCRAGELGEAECVITNMPFEPDAAIRMMLLSACRLHGDVERGNRAALNLLELDPKNGAPYLVMSNLYAAAGLWDKVAKLSELMIAENVDRQSGCSIVYVKNKKHVFVVRDSFHPQKKAIYAEVERLSRLTKQAGYVPDLNLELHNTEEEQKEKLLLSHSEKLAIAFALISTPSKTTIRIIKNLRVCGDCHSFLKVLSKIVGREVVIRDASRFHHFKDGLCSCGDYW